MLTWTSVDVEFEGESRSRLPFGSKLVHHPWYNTAQLLAQKDPEQQQPDPYDKGLQVHMTPAYECHSCISLDSEAVSLVLHYIYLINL